MAKATKSTAKNTTSKKVTKNKKATTNKTEETNESTNELVQPAASKLPAPTSEQPEKETQSGAAAEPDTQANENAGDPGKENNVDKIHIVIPYLASAAAGGELQYALRSLAASFPEARLIVVGDKEDWFSDEVVHLQHVPESDNPQIDVAQKLLLVLASGVIESECFILSNDDIFLLGQTSLDDIYTLKAFGVLDRNVGKVGGKYNQNAENTRKALAKEKLSLHRYGTHTPVGICKHCLAEVLDRYNAAEEGHLVTSLYFNSNYPDARPIQVTGGQHDPILVSVYRGGVDTGLLEDALEKRKFLNVNDAGWRRVEPYMAKLYPNKSKWEK